MERTAIRAWRQVTRRPWRSALVLVAALAGCSSAALLFSGKTPPPSTRPSLVTRTAVVPPAAQDKPPLALEQFSPLLAEPRFREVAEALQVDDTRRAAEILRRVLDQDPLASTATVELWSGLLFEKIGDAGRSLGACERAAAATGHVLADYSELCVARALLASGRAKQALEALSAKAYAGPTEPERRLLVAQAARASGDRERAIAALRIALSPDFDRVASAKTALELSELLLERKDSAVEALRWIRRALVVLSASRAERARADDLERIALVQLTPAEQKLYAVPEPEHRVARLAALLNAREYELVERWGRALLDELPPAERFANLGCEAQLLRAKALAGSRKPALAAEALADARDKCTGDVDRGARIWFLSGRYAVSAGRYTEATAYFTDLEKRYPQHSLTDDARFYAAIAQQELGIEARFTELLMTLPEDYPAGDMASEGLFRLALRRMERGAWSDAAGLLERGMRHVDDSDASRALESSGRERYFRARALLALGDRAQGLSELEAVIEEHPLSYYMVQAYSWLEELEPGRAGAVVARAEEHASREPFRIASRPELERPGFARMMELLRIGELDAAVRELDVLGLRRAGTGSELLWGIAMLYERAGFSKFSADLAKRQLNEVVGRWPVGGWGRAWQMAFPRPYLPIVTSEVAATGVDPALVYAVMREESAFDPDVVSSANAYGLMQLIVPTAKLLAAKANLPYGPEALRRPKVNVALGCRALADFSARFPENPLLAIPAYNAGPGRPQRWLRERPGGDFDLWIELIPYAETRRYMKRVLSSRAIYAFLYEPAIARSRLVLPLRVVPAPAPL